MTRAWSSPVRWEITAAVAGTVALGVSWLAGRIW